MFKKHQKKNEIAKCCRNGKQLMVEIGLHMTTKVKNCRNNNAWRNLHISNIYGCVLTIYRHIGFNK